MNVADEPEQPPAVHERVRDLLCRCAATPDPVRRATLLARIADELDRAAADITTTNPASAREIVAVLRGQADMARFISAVERRDPDRRVG